MDLIKNQLKSLIKRQLKEHGIVIWYDPEGVYKGIMGQSDFINVSVIKYEESYYEVRFKAEGYFNDEEKKDILIYIEHHRDVANFPLIELEKAGCILEPTASLDKNTDPATIVKKILSNRFPSDLVVDICKRIEKKTITIDEIEHIIEEAKSIQIGALSPLLKTNNPQILILSFIADTKYDKSLKEKKLLSDLINFLDNYLGIQLKNVKEGEDIREKLVEKILMVDFIESLESELAGKYHSLKLPSKKEYKENVKKLVGTWRKRSDFNKSYKTWAEKIQRKYEIEKEKFPPDALTMSETFPVVEEKLIEFVLNLNKKKGLNFTKEIINKRKSSFWAKNEPKYGLLWSFLSYSINLLISINQAFNEIEGKSLSLSECINYYTGKNKPWEWSLIDKYYRLMETKYSDVDIEGKFEDKLEIFISECRQKYSEFINIEAKLFLSQFSPSAYLSTKNIIHQKDIFKQKLLPFLEKKKKCAYFLVDAFRYEMGKDFLHSIENYEKKDISPALAAIPTLTSFGMLSLLLYFNEEINIEKTGKKIYLQVNDNKASKRSERLSYFSQRCPYKMETFKLEQVIKPRKNIRDKIDIADFIIVTSQEIDSICESGKGLIAKEIMNKITVQIKRAIYTLARLGVEIFVITADHGYLLGPEISKDMKIKVPKGETCVLHKRVWIGRGGDEPENTVRFKASDFGYKCNLDFVFPETVAVFNTPGEENPYVHGGISLQEVIIPLLELKMKAFTVKKSSFHEKYFLTISKKIITNRIFTVKVTYETELLIFDDMNPRGKRVRIQVVKEGSTIGQAETAEYGFDEGTKEVILEPNKPDIVTVILNENIALGVIDIYLLDSETEMELAKFSDINVKITV